MKLLRKNEPDGAQASVRGADNIVEEEDEEVGIEVQVELDRDDEKLATFCRIREHQIDRRGKQFRLDWWTKHRGRAVFHELLLDEVPNKHEVKEAVKRRQARRKNDDLVAEAEDLLAYTDDRDDSQPVRFQGRSCSFLRANSRRWSNCSDDWYCADEDVLTESVTSVA